MARSPAEPQQNRVVVVEDEADVGSLLEVILAKEGFRVGLARTGQEALEEIRLQLVAELGGYRSATMLRGRIDGLLTALAQATQRPTDQQAEWVGTFDGQLQTVLGDLRTVLDTDIHALNQAIEALGLPPIRTTQRPVS